MGEASWQLPRETVGDLAYALLRESGRPMHLRDLIAAIAARGLVQASGPARLAALIHTEINLDSRLQHLGGGLWGLKCWSPRRPRSEAGAVTGSRRRQGWVPDAMGPAAAEEIDDEPVDRDLQGYADDGWPDEGERWEE